jgi:hypothetical protein
MNETLPDSSRPPRAADDSPRRGDVEASAPRIPKTLFVLDTTAVAGHPPRSHEMIENGVIKTYTFKPGEALELPLATAIKFLKHEAFKRTDKDGNLEPYARRPKQPDEMGAGERFVIGDDQTIASYGELTNMALLQRTLELPGGEAIRDKGDRQSMIDFLRESGIKDREAKRSKQPDIGKDEFLPTPEIEDAA